jgi:hypothetical protein
MCAPCVVHRVKASSARPRGFQDVEAPRFQDNQHMKLAGSSALHTGHLYPPGYIPSTHFCCGPGSSVGIATDSGLDCPGIESRWEQDFPPLSRPALGPHPASCTMGTGCFLGVKRPGRGADHLPPPSAEVENEYCYTSTPHLGPWWPVVG